MKGLLKEKSEIEKLKQEFQILTEIKKKEVKKVKTKEEELVLEEC